MAYATVSDVAEDIGRPITSEEEAAQVERWLNRVEARIRQRITDLDDRADDDPNFTDILQGVEVDVVVRRLQNPTGKKSERLDDYAYSLDSSATKTDLWPTPEEWDELIIVSRPHVRSVRLVSYGDR